MELASGQSSVSTTEISPPESVLTQNSGRFRSIRRILPDGSHEYEDEEFDVPAQPGFSIQEKLVSDKFNIRDNFVKELQGSDVTVAHFQREGFNNPILIRDKEGLGLKVPNVGIHEIRAQVSL
jgi:hypothetical protein